MVSKSQRNAQRWILEDLHSVGSKPIWNIGEFLRIYGKNIWLRWWASSLLAEFSPRWVKVWKNWLVLPIQMTETIKDKSFSIQQILSGLNTNDISLNHLWTRYKVPDLDEEVSRVTEYMKNDPYTVFEDEAGRKFGMRWLFIWLEDKHNLWKPRIDVPMFEIVLIEETSDVSPHIQFDIDTLLTAWNIQSKIQSTMRLPQNESPFSFHLDIPKRVLSMWVYNNKNWFNHEVWIGTDDRNREDHRNTMVKIS